MSAFGDLKYPADFPHFDYVDPKAPKGGAFSQIGPGTIFNQNQLTFNSLNSYILRGDAAQGMELTFATPDGARRATSRTRCTGSPPARCSISADGLTYRFALRPEARFHDGSRLTAHDVAFSLTTLKEKGHPIITQFLRDFAGAEAPDDATVVVRFAPGRARDVPLFVAGLPIFSRAVLQRSGRSTRRRSTCRSAAGPTRSAASKPAAISSTSACRTGGAPICRSRAGSYNFDTRALRVLSRPRRRLRGLHRQELSVPRGVHLAHLGDALRLPGDQGRPRQARGAARRHAVRGAGLVPQHAAGRSSRIRSCARR